MSLSYPFKRRRVSSVIFFPLSCCFIHYVQSGKEVITRFEDFKKKSVIQVLHPDLEYMNCLFIDHESYRFVPEVFILLLVISFDPQDTSLCFSQMFFIQTLSCTPFYKTRFIFHSSLFCEELLLIPVSVSWSSLLSLEHVPYYHRKDCLSWN